MKQIFRLDIVAQEGDFDRISGLLTLGVSFGWEEESLATGETRFRVHCEQEDFLQKLRERVSHAAPETHCTLEALEARTGSRLGGSFSRRSAAARVLWYCRPGWPKARTFRAAHPFSSSPKAPSVPDITPPRPCAWGL